MKEWTYESMLKSMDDNKRRDINIISLYWKYKKPLFTNRQQAEIQFKRCLRAAKQLVPYEDDRLVSTIEWLENNADFKWTLETVLKYITEDLTKIKHARN